MFIVSLKKNLVLCVCVPLIAAKLLKNILEGIFQGYILGLNVQTPAVSAEQMDPLLSCHYDLCGYMAATS